MSLKTKRGSQNKLVDNEKKYEELNRNSKNDKNAMMKPKKHYKNK